MNTDLIKARSAKMDEFYTQLTDIEKELSHYKDYFAGKVVFCNCDDPAESNFWKYFSLQFDFLRLKKLIATHYENERPSYKLEMHDSTSGAIRTALKQNGDFRSPECLNALMESDIVVTNPPFSLFREYVDQLMTYDKKFIIIGNMNAIACKEIFRLMSDNRIWLGHSIHSGDREFRVPDKYPLNAAGSRIDENGNKFLRIKGVRWYTNLDYKERHDNLILDKMYNETAYPKYDNYDAINVDKTQDIPKDYAGVMGVPITFMDKYNPDQFHIIGQTSSSDKSAEVELLRTDRKRKNRGIVHGDSREKYARILIQRIGATE